MKCCAYIQTPAVWLEKSGCLWLQFPNIVNQMSCPASTNCGINSLVDITHGLWDPSSHSNFWHSTATIHWIYFIFMVHHPGRPWLRGVLQQVTLNLWPSLLYSSCLLCSHSETLYFSEEPRARRNPSLLLSCCHVRHISSFPLLSQGTAIRRRMWESY